MQKYIKSWIEHFLLLFFTTIVTLILDISIFAPIYFAIAIEAAQYDIFGIAFRHGDRGIIWYDYLMDLIFDGLGIYVGYILFPIFLNLI